MDHSDYYTEAIHGKHEYLDLGHFEFEMGASLPNAKLAYKTHGKLNAAKNNAILFPHMYSGTPLAMERFIGEGRPLDPNKYFIILPGQFGNGFSSSPSNTPPPSDRGAFPQVTIGDDVRAQHLLVTETFGIEALQLVLGWSMGAEQTYEWAVRYPDMVLRAIPFAGTAKTTPHDWLFVRMHENVIKADPPGVAVFTMTQLKSRRPQGARGVVVGHGRHPEVLQERGLARGRVFFARRLHAQPLGGMVHPDGPQ